MPITWRNINSQGMGEASSLLNNARASMNAGLGDLAKIVEQRQAVNAQNVTAQRDTNTQTFLNRLAEFRTPEQFQAALDSGAIAGMQAEFGGVIDQDVARTAAEGRLSDLIRTAGQQRAYEKETDTLQVTPVMDRIMGAVEANRDAEAADLIAKHNDILAKTGNLSRAQQMLRTRNREEVKEGREDTLWDQGQAEIAEDLRIDQILGDGLQRLAPAIASGEIDQTAARNALTSALYADPTTSGAGLRKLTEAGALAEQAMAQRGSMAAGDAAVLTAQLDEAKDAYHMESNPYFLEQNANPVAAANEAIMGVMDANPDFADILDDNAVRRSIISQAQEAIETGVKVGDETIKLTPSDVQNALLQVGSRYFWDRENVDFKNILRDYAESNGLAKRYQDYRDFKALEAELKGTLRAAGQRP